MNSRDKGKRGERELAAILKEYGYNEARRGQQYCGADGSADVIGLPGIERERREGKPICASSSSDSPGYYKPANREELTRYINRLRKRAGEIFKTRRALQKVLEEMEV